MATQKNMLNTIAEGKHGARGASEEPDTKAPATQVHKPIMKHSYNDQVPLDAFKARPDMLVHNIVQCIDDWIKYYRHGDMLEAIDGGRKMATQLMRIPNSPWKPDFFEIILEHARARTFDIEQEEISQRFSVVEAKNRVFPVLVFFTSALNHAKSCFEDGEYSMEALNAAEYDPRAKYVDLENDALGKDIEGVSVTSGKTKQKKKEEEEE
ncbi:hypothetical protein B0O99DRAFT_682058 [Bisporella sp. PMI_857]|nr:hypothetical protein B0O99DRAFT_590837 [Bisporella sp. PMI_857]KAH8600372.1 hypothetical protein B0O99DRAFT_682058 [Bisporella sp. PMI_857]